MSVFSFRRNPTGNTLSDEELLTSAMEQPMAISSTIGDQFLGGLRRNVFGSIAADAELPAAAPTEPGLVYRPPQPDLPDISNPRGLLEPGTVDLDTRPTVRNADGSVSTVRSMSINEDGREILIPTVSDDGRVMEDDEAVNLYRQTGKHLGKFDTPESATLFAERLHEREDARTSDIVVPDTPQMRTRLSGADRGRFAQPIEFRTETPAELAARRDAARAITEDEWKVSSAYRKGLEWDAGMTTPRAEAIAAEFDRRRVREFFGEKRPLASFVGQFGSEFLNPINFIPVTGPAVRAAAVARLGRVGGGAAVGTVDSAIGSAIENVVTRQSRASFGDDVSWQATVSDIAISALVGTAFGAAGGFVGGRLDARRERLRASAEERLGTLARTEEGRFVLNDAVDGIVNGEGVDLSPMSQDAVQRATTRTMDLIREAPIREIDGVGRGVPALTPHTVAAGDGFSINVTPRVVEARDLLTSADEGFDAALQPRQRDRAAAQTQVQQIASSLDPMRLGASAEADRGAPIVGPDRMVESGNGRVLALRQAYREDGDAAKRYRDWLQSMGADISGMSEPVLVRERATALDAGQRQAFTVAANRPATLTLSASERAKIDASNLTPDTLALIRNPEDLASGANIPFMRQFVRTLPQSEAGSLTTPDGRVSAEGVTRIRNAMLAAAYDDASTLGRLTEATDDGVRSISNALTAAAPSWAALRRDIAAGRVPASLDVTSALLEAVKRTADIRAQGMKLGDYLSQTDAFDAMPETVEGFMRLFYDPSGKRAAGSGRIVDGLRRYADEARKVTTAEGLDLGLPEVTARELIDAANGRAADGAETGLFGAAGAGDGTDAYGRGLEAGRSGDGFSGLGDAAEGGGRVVIGGRTAERVGDAEAEAFFNGAPERSLDKLYRDIPKWQAELDEAGADISKALGAKFDTPGLKAREGAAEKMTRKGYQSTRQLTDLVRGGFVARTPGEADEIVARLADRFDVLDEGWKAAPSGYVDRKVMLRFEDGTIGEVQLWEPSLLKAKKAGGHKLYAEARSLPPRDPRREALEQRQRELYSAASENLGDDWRRTLGSGGNGPNLIRKSAESMADPLSDTSALSTSVQSPPLARTANAVEPLDTAGRRSQSTNINDAGIGRTLEPEGGARLDIARAASFFDEQEANALADAGRRAAMPDSTRAMAEQYRVDPATGDFDELAEVAQIREEGRLSPEDEVELQDATRGFELGDAYGDALRAAVGCVI